MTHTATVRAAYRRIVNHPRHDGPWVGMAALRDEAGLTRTDFDTAVHELMGSRDVRIEPQPIRAILTAADRRAAVHIGGEDRHQITIDQRH